MAGGIAARPELMLRPTSWWRAVAPVDLRYGMDRLLLVVQDHLGPDGFDGAAYVFRNKSGPRMKIVCADAQGVGLCVRRLHRGTFVSPHVDDAVWTLSVEQRGFGGIRRTMRDVFITLSELDSQRANNCLWRAPISSEMTVAGSIASSQPHSKLSRNM